MWKGEATGDLCCGHGGAWDQNSKGPQFQVLSSELPALEEHRIREHSIFKYKLHISVLAHVYLPVTLYTGPPSLSPPPYCQQLALLIQPGRESSTFFM